MIISRTPLRITLGGGGTDLPSYYGTHGGFVISAAINRYIFIAINRTFGGDYFLKYSELERVAEVDDIEHPIIREALRLHPIGKSVELVSVADIPAGTGLGSSGAFTVGLLRALYAHQREHVTAANLAEEACRIEIDILHRPVGKQDQYISAFGGLTCFEIAPDGQVQVSPLLVSNETLRDLEEHMCMFFTHFSRPADRVLDEQRTKSEAGDRDMVESLHFVKENGLATKAALERGDTAAFAELMDEHWRRKRRRSSMMSNDRIDHCYELAMSSGALGGKLVGAGSGGFLLFYAKDLDSLRGAMAAEGLSEVRFAFDFDGSSLLVRD
ncbi:MAG TPA: galactokinase [Acidimicrobiales bacterium]|nr:galactokinase [Acidimicrobiales bacterium]